MSESANQAPHHRFWVGQVRPRRKLIMRHRRVRQSAALAFALTLSCALGPLGDVDVVTVANAALGFAAISFGACVTGAVLALTLPSEERVREMSTKGLADTGFSHYSDLIFTFTWSAVSQIGLIGVIVAGYMFAADETLWPRSVWPSHVVLLFIAGFVWWYAVFGLFGVVATISQIGAFVIADVDRRAKPGPGAVGGVVDVAGADRGSWPPRPDHSPGAGS